MARTPPASPRSRLLVVDDDAAIVNQREQIQRVLRDVSANKASRRKAAWHQPAVALLQQYVLTSEHTKRSRS